MTRSQEEVFHKPRKRFGQNFLHDIRIIQRIVSSIAPKENEPVLEIGPGQGALTAVILPYQPQLTAVELDRDLAAMLRLKFADNKHFSLIEGDALQFDLHSLNAAPHSLRVVGNLPYNISTPLLFHLLAQRDCIRDMHFMLQKEVVQRMAAEPGNKDYGRLSIMAQYYCRVTPLFDVPPGCFFPPPKVMSAIVRLQPCTPELTAHNTQTLSQLVNIAFQQRRKTLRNTLKVIATEEQIIAADINPDARAETLSVTDFVRLANQLDNTPEGDLPTCLA
ncbi:MAG TPA: 16S rRNA (adenine(1518)-N(6)/adenine(1519)-N(6))-dimethyltransferase RsmA [Pseudomonadales bacterium]|nr:16S rRNA (adenine(1518)-N(6)/adenine(1519)-N(6))-dimethyltransferase RsmA [Pseudomonadales bacterium]